MRCHTQGPEAACGRDAQAAGPAPETPGAAPPANPRPIVPPAVRPLLAWAARVLWLVPLLLLLALVGALADLGAKLHAENADLHGQLFQAFEEQCRMNASLEQAQRTTENLRATGNLAQAAAAQVVQLANELAEARSRMSLTEQQLSAAHQRLSNLEPAALKVPGLEAQLLAARDKLLAAQKQLQDGQKLSEQLRTELALQARRLAQLQNLKPPVDPAVAQAAALRQANDALAAQIDALQAELLTLAAAGPPVPPAPPPLPEPAPPAPAHWALRISYDAAHAFLVLHSDQDSLAAAPVGGAEPWIAGTGLLVENAVRTQIVYDQDRQRVYDATLEASLAADAPPGILAENKALIAGFLRTFAPDLQDAQAVLAAAPLLAGQDASRLLVFRGADTTVSLWNDKTGVYTFRVASSHEAGE